MTADLASALENHAARIGAELNLAVDLDGKVIPGAKPPAAWIPTLVAALNAAPASDAGGASSYVTPPGLAGFHCARAAPDEIGRVALGFS